MEKSDVCVSVFQNGTPCKVEYTTKWAALINRLLQDSRVLTAKEGKA